MVILVGSLALPAKDVEILSKIAESTISWA